MVEKREWLFASDGFILPTPTIKSLTFRQSDMACYSSPPATQESEQPVNRRREQRYFIAALVSAWALPQTMDLREHNLD
jgi:hypothetical protein